MNICVLFQYKIFRNRYRYFLWEQNFSKPIPILFLIPKFYETDTDTFFDTKVFRNRYRYFFRYQNFSKPIPILFSIPKFFETDTDTIKKLEKFRNREVSKPKCHTLVYMHHENSWISCHRRATNSCRPSFSEEAPNVQQAKCPTTKPWPDNKESCFGNNSWLIWCKFADSQTHKSLFCSCCPSSVQTSTICTSFASCSDQIEFKLLLNSSSNTNWIVCLFIIIV